ncbi:MAG TPA: hypothetical protein VHE55_05205 [Fimbriimonadaceae bacterium]|nr:hypothetical protein [Fimbriimonadaceae bacterium]
MARQAIRRWWPVLAGVLFTIPLGLWTSWRARQPEFTFLAGQKPLVPEFLVPANAPFGGPGFYETVYGFQADPKRITQMADEQLLRAGWTKDHDYDEILSRDGVKYTEPGPYGRVMDIDFDVAVPTYAATTDIISIGSVRKGWVGIVMTQDKKPPPDWRTRMSHWLAHVFLGRP